MYIGQLIVYDGNEVTPICEEILSKEKSNFLHFAWSLDSTYLLSVTSDVSHYVRVCEVQIIYVYSLSYNFLFVNCDLLKCHICMDLICIYVTT